MILRYHECAFPCCHFVPHLLPSPNTLSSRLTPSESSFLAVFLVPSLLGMVAILLAFRYTI